MLSCYGYPYWGGSEWSRARTGTYDCVFSPGMDQPDQSTFQSNRVLRLYKEFQDCFLRVNFADEEKLQYRLKRNVDGSLFIQERVGDVLKVDYAVCYV